jgi:hypothetical protein
VPSPTFGFGRADPLLPLRSGKMGGIGSATEANHVTPRLQVSASHTTPNRYFPKAHRIRVGIRPHRIRTLLSSQLDATNAVGGTANGGADCPNYGCHGAVGH